MEKWELTDEELEDVAERTCLRDMERAIATAASDKTMKWVMDKLIAEDETIAAMFVKTWIERGW